MVVKKRIKEIEKTCLYGLQWSFWITHYNYQNCFGWGITGTTLLNECIIRTTFLNDTLEQHCWMKHYENNIVEWHIGTTLLNEALSEQHCWMKHYQNNIVEWSIMRTTLLNQTLSEQHCWMKHYDNNIIEWSIMRTTLLNEALW